MQYSIWVSFYEIYNEFLYDLLDAPHSLSLKKRVTLRLSDDGNGNPYVRGEHMASRARFTVTAFCFFLTWLYEYGKGCRNLFLFPIC